MTRVSCLVSARRVIQISQTAKKWHANLHVDENLLSTKSTTLQNLSVFPWITLYFTPTRDGVVEGMPTVICRNDAGSNYTGGDISFWEWSAKFESGFFW